MVFHNGLFLFHRDFRLYDNTGLAEAIKKCEKVYTLFIFTPEQVSSKNTYKSTNSVEFMIQSLEHLEDDIKKHNGKLIIQYGNTMNVLKDVIETLSIDCVFFNYDLTPYAKERTKNVESLCKKMNITCMHSHDYYLLKPGDVLTGNGTMYHKFTPFYEKYMLFNGIQDINKKPITKLATTRKTLSNTISLEKAFDKFVGRSNNHLFVKGGRNNGLIQLKKSLLSLKDYDQSRDTMSIQTSGLSAYLKYGCISIREVYHGFKQKYGKFHELIRQLVWRDFFAHLLYFYPESLGKLYYSKMASLKWNKNDTYLEAWKRGQTGVPLVDAGMRQMNETGYMHNRVRMLVATYLTKILLIDWKEGEKYFAQTLVDYDVASNSGNWQSVVGGGVYAMPWFRVLSPWSQSKEYDSKCVYIKQWVKELTDVDPKIIHKWYKYCKTNDYKNIYKCPIVDDKKQREKFMDMMK